MDISLKLSQAHGVAVASNREYGSYSTGSCVSNYQSQSKRINLGNKEDEGKRTKLLKRENKKGLCF